MRRDTIIACLVFLAMFVAAWFSVNSFADREYEWGRQAGQRHADFVWGRRMLHVRARYDSILVAHGIPAPRDTIRLPPGVPGKVNFYYLVDE